MMYGSTYTDIDKKKVILKSSSANLAKRKEGTLGIVCYGATFVLILLFLIFRNQRMVLYVYEVFYIILIFLVASKKGIRLGPYTLWSLLFFIICLASALWAQDQIVAFKQAFNVLRIVLICNAVTFFIDNDENRLNFVLRSYIVSSVVLSIFLMYMTPIYYWGSSRLGYSIGLNPNALGLIMAISAIISVYFAKMTKSNLYFAIAALFSLVALFSGSRKSLVLIAFGLAALYVFSIKRWRRLVFLIPVLVVVGYGLWHLILTNEALYRVLGLRVQTLVSGLSGGDTDFSTLVRLNMIDTGIHLFWKKPLFGYGAHNFSVMTPYSYSHNNYVELLVGVGSLGFLAYYSGYVRVIYRLWKSIKLNPYSSLFLSLVLGLAIMEYGLVSYYIESYQIVIACAYSSVNIHSSKALSTVPEMVSNDY